MKVYSYNRRRIKFVFVMAALALGKDIRQKWQYHSGQQGGVFNIRDTQPDRG